MKMSQRKCLNENVPTKMSQQKCLNENVSMKMCPQNYLSLSLPLACSLARQGLGRWPVSPIVLDCSDQCGWLFSGQNQIIARAPFEINQCLYQNSVYFLYNCQKSNICYTHATGKLFRIQFRTTFPLYVL